MTALTIPRRELAAAVAERLTTVTNATGYVGQIGAMNGLPGVVVTPNDPPPKSTTDQRVKPYFVLFPGIGRPGPELDLGDCHVDLDWPIQVTAAAGDTDDLLALVDRIDAVLHRWSPGIFGAAPDQGIAGPLRPLPGYVPPFLTDTKVDPPRLYTPLQYQLTAHT